MVLLVENHLLIVSRKKHGTKRTIHAKGQVVDRGNVHCSHAASGFSVCSQIADFPLVVYMVKS